MICWLRTVTSLALSLVERGKDTVKLVKNLKLGGTMIILIDQGYKSEKPLCKFSGLSVCNPDWGHDYGT
jgi:hypothetical protein